MSRYEVWIFKFEYAAVTVRNSRSVKKKMIPIFLESYGIECVVFVTQQKVTTMCYIELFLPMVIESLKYLRLNSRIDIGSYIITMHQLTLRKSASTFYHCETETA